MSTATTEKKLSGAAAAAHDAKVAREQGSDPRSPAEVAEAEASRQEKGELVPPPESTAHRTAGGHPKEDRPRQDTAPDPRPGAGEVDQTQDGESLIQPGESHNDAERRLHMALTKDGRPAGPGRATHPAPDPSEYGLRPGESHNDAERRLHMPLDAAGYPLNTPSA